MKEVISMFGKSPVAAIETHANVCLECAEKLRDLFQETDAQRRHGIVKEIVELERQADDIKREVRQSLRKRLFMPVSKHEVLELVFAQDKIANKTKDVAQLYHQRFDRLPEPLQARFMDFVESSLAAVAQARRSVHELDELYETGFRGAEVELVSQMVEELDRLESESDELQWELRRALHKIENTMSPVDVMFLYTIIRTVGEVGDVADQTGRQLELMLSS